MIRSMIDLKKKENMRIYYAFKGRFAETLDCDEKERIENDAVTAVTKFFKDGGYDYIAIPESSSTFIENIACATGFEYVKIEKLKKDEILKLIDSINLQKKEKDNHIERFNEMGDSFKVNKLKANQRRKYKNIIFRNDICLPPGKGFILDDSFFSGTTFEALKLSTGIEDGFFIFSK